MGGLPLPFPRCRHKFTTSAPDSASSTIAAAGGRSAAASRAFSFRAFGTRSLGELAPVAITVVVERMPRAYFRPVVELSSAVDGTEISTRHSYFRPVVELSSAVDRRRV